MTPAAALLCLAVGVSDDDTVKVRCGEGEEQRVRLVQVDAPEKGQTYGHRAKQELSGLIYGKTIELLPVDTDRYGRTVAQLRLQGTDVNFEMVRLGFAWCYRKYLHDQNALSRKPQPRATNAACGTSLIPCRLGNGGMSAESVGRKRLSRYCQIADCGAQKCGYLSGYQAQFSNLLSR